MTDDRLRQAALDLIHKIQATGEAQDVEEADSFIVGAFDPETGRTSYIGSFPGPIEALEFAEGWAAELNRGNGPDEVAFTTSVYPMMDPNQ